LREKNSGQWATVVSFKVIYTLNYAHLKS